MTKRPVSPTGETGHTLTYWISTDGACLIMSSTLWVIITAVALLVHVVLHEAAHALALRRMGGDIASAGIGLPLPPMLRFPPRGRRTWEFTLSPWLLGAYIWPDKRSEKMLPDVSYTNRAWFAGAGVVVNLITGLAVWGALNLWRGNYRWAAAWIGLAVGAWFLRKAITFVLPVFGVVALIQVIAGMFARPNLPQGPVGAAVVISEATTATHALALIGALAIAMAVVNCVPIYPFDGGRVADAALRRLFGNRTANVFTLTTTFCALGFLLYAVGTDVWYLIT